MYRRIRRTELNELAQEWHFSLDEKELDDFHTLTEYISDTTDGVAALPQPAPQNVPAVRDPGHPPGDDEDPYNAVVRWCSVKLEGAEGVLSGTRIGVKDSISVAGVPLTGGSNILRDFVPTADSVVAERVLQAGGEIVAMLNMDYLAFSGGGDSSAYGPTLCAFDTTRTAGGSSGGSGAALHYDDIDITVGCDQGGSIRVPAAWSGVIGLKPTHGLVPYVGIMGIDQPIDYAGPMAKTAADAARLLQAIAGKHPVDPRQPAEVPVQNYIQAVDEAPDHLRGLRVGVVAEGFSDDLGVEQETKDATRATIDRLAELGAEVHEVSVPEHLRGGGVAFTGFMEGMTALMTAGGNGMGWKGRYWPELSRAVGSGLKAFGDELSDQVKLTLMVGSHMRRQYHGEVYARAHNLHPWLRAGYDRALADVDVLVMPTSPGRPHVVDPSLTIAERVMRGWGVLANTAPMNITGHPTITLPTAEVDGLPVGLMVMARHFEDDRLLALARTFEGRFGWAPEHPGDPRSARRPQALASA
jgi:amidase